MTVTSRRTSLRGQTPSRLHRRTPSATGNKSIMREGRNFSNCANSYGTKYCPERCGPVLEEECTSTNLERKTLPLLRPESILQPAAAQRFHCLGHRRISGAWRGRRGRDYRIAPAPWKHSTGCSPSAA
ncbi:hypothetical protein RHECNPAF_890014 [Rhizobium etli CNPAF512]|nr:hypothetical protein RHECNPAF_890014 [Rhizobium etli CNPAF512]